MTDKDTELLSDKVSLISEKVAVTDERVSHLNDKVQCLDVKMSSQKKTIDEIHTAVTKNSVNTGWTKKLIVLMLTVVIGGMLSIGIKSFVSDDGKEAHAAQPKQEQAVDKDGRTEKP